MDIDSDLIDTMEIQEVKFDLSFGQCDAIRALKASDIMHDECLQVTEMLNRVMEPEALIALHRDMEVGMASISLGGNTFECGQKIADTLQGASSAYVFVATLGPEVSVLYNHLQEESDFLKAYWLDMLANVAVDRMTAKIRKLVSDKASQSGLRATSNWGPGYCQWQLTEQKRLLGLIPGAEKLVTLTESMLMKPMKSLAGIIGIGKMVRYHVSNCSDCTLDHCFYKSQCR